MAINGTHMLFYTSEADKLRAMLRDVFGFKWVDAHGGWLIFRLPPAEVGVHPAEGPTFDSGVRHQISFMCDDINKTIEDLLGKGVNVDTATKAESYGITTMMHLPGGCEVMLYEPRHAIAADIKRRSAKKPAKKPARPRQRATAGSRARTKERSSRRAKKAPRRR